MEISNLKNEEEKEDKGSKNSSKNREDKIQTQFRLVVGKDAVVALEELLSTVNNGFTAGSVTKSDLATYLFTNAHRFLKKAEIVKIRAEFFDERVALEHLIQSSESNGKLPEELRKLLRDQHRSSLESLKSEV